jgi:ceramide glucosyltransferase
MRITGDEVVGVNPKVNNLIRSYHQAAHDIIWVVDSGIMVAPGTLARSVDALVGPPSSAANRPRRQIGLVHHVPFAFSSGGGKLGSRLEEAFLNTNHAKMYIALNTIAVDSCVVGKSNLWRRSDVERVNGSEKTILDAAHGGSQTGERGLAAFGRFLAEDNMIARALWHELGQRHDLSCDVVRNAVGHMTLSDYVWRRVRWVRVRKHMVLAATLLEPFTESIVLGLIGAASLRYLTGLSAWILLLIHFVSIVLIDLDVYASLAGHPLPTVLRWQFMGAWAARELLALPIWMLAMLGSEVEWRGKKYQVLRNGEVKRVSGSGIGTGRWFRWGRRKDLEQYEPANTHVED